MDVVAVAGPMALLYVVTDCFEQVGLVEVPDLYDVRGILDGDGVGLDVDDAALRVVSVSRQSLHVLCCEVLRCDSVSQARATSLCCVLIESSCLPLSTINIEH